MTLAAANRYIERVQSGEYTAGRLVKLAVRRHLLDLEHGAKRGLVFDEDEVARAAEVYPQLRHTTGKYAGSAFELRDFQAFVVAMLFGWRRLDGSRRFREVFFSVGRGNGKSPFCAATALLVNFLDGEDRAAGFCFATGQKQSRVVWDEVVRFINKSDLAGSLAVNTSPPNGPSIRNPEDGSTLEPLASNGTNADGQVPHVIVVDELHEWQETHRKLWDKIVTSMGKAGRRHPLLLVITTAGSEDSHIWNEQLDYSERVVSQADGATAPESWFGDDHFSFVACLDRDDDIHDEACWPKANPMLCEPNPTVDIGHLRTLAGKSRAGDLRAAQQLRRYHCNLRTAGTSRPLEAIWAECAGELPRLEDYPAWGGLDLARSRDFSAVTLVWRLDDGRRVMRSWGFTCEDRSERLYSNEFLRVLEADNVQVHPGGQIEFPRIEDLILELHERYRILSWAYDSRYAEEMSQRLRDSHGLDMHEFRQTPRDYNEPLDDFLAAVRSRQLLHDGEHLLTWSAGNLIIRTGPDGLSMPDKGRSVNKIDPVVAGIMAWRESMFSTAAPRASFYDTHELEIG